MSELIVMTYSNYFKSVLYGFLSCCLVFVLTILYIVGTPTSSAYAANAFYQSKFKYANSINVPKILIVAGSNATYGINSHLIEKETGIPTVNLGSGAGFGAGYMLHLAQPLAKSGDTILLPLEYEAYELNPGHSEPLIDYVLAYDPQYLMTHPQLIASVPRSRLIGGILSKFHAPVKVETLKYIDKEGNAIDNSESKMTAEQRKSIAKIPPIITRGKLDRSALNQIKDFSQWCRSQNIKLLATWPNTLRFEEYQQPIYQNFFQAIENFYKNIGVAVLGKPSDFMYEQSMFYDSRYHLHDRGVMIRTRKLIGLIKSHLN